MAAQKKKLNWLWIVIIAVVVIAVGVWIGIAQHASSSQYAAVYLTTGDVYYGKLSWFPHPHLTNVWFLDRAGTATSSQVGVSPLVSVFWGPQDEINLNADQIVFWTYLTPSSAVAKAMAAAAAATSTGAAAPSPTGY